MAQKVQVLLVCDLHDDETEGTETVTFGLDGSSYEIDLCDEHAAAMREDLATYVGAARRGSRPATGARRPAAGASSRRSAASNGAGDVNAVREWGRANGWKVSDRGRLSGELRAAYDAAH